MIAPSPKIAVNTAAAARSSSSSSSSTVGASSTSYTPPSCHRQYSETEAFKRRMKASEAAASMMMMAMRPTLSSMPITMPMHTRMQMPMYSFSSSNNKRDFMPPLPTPLSSCSPRHLYHDPNSVSSSQMYYDDDQIRHAKRRRLLLLSPSSSMMTSVAISTATATATSHEECSQRMMFSPPKQYQRNLQQQLSHKKKNKSKKHVSFAPRMTSASSLSSTSSTSTSSSSLASATESPLSPSPLSPRQQKQLLLEEIHSYEITKDDVDNAWYSPQQYKDFISDCRSILETVRSRRHSRHDHRRLDDTDGAVHDDKTVAAAEAAVHDEDDEDEASSCCTRGLEDQLVAQTQRMKLKRRRYLIKTVVEQYAVCTKEWEQRTTTKKCSDVLGGGGDGTGSHDGSSKGCIKRRQRPRNDEEKVNDDFCPKTMISSWIRDVSLKLSVHSTLQAKKLGDSDEKFVNAIQH